MALELNNSREPSVSSGKVFGRPSLVTWTVLVIRGGGSGRVSQNRAAAATMTTAPAA